jgi:hypothetical protein
LFAVLYISWNAPVKLLLPEDSRGARDADLIRSECNLLVPPVISHLSTASSRFIFDVHVFVALSNGQLENGTAVGGEYSVPFPISRDTSSTTLSALAEKDALSPLPVLHEAFNSAFKEKNSLLVPYPLRFNLASSQSLRISNSAYAFQTSSVFSGDAYPWTAAVALLTTIRRLKKINKDA